MSSTSLDLDAAPGQVQVTEPCQAAGWMIIARQEQDCRPAALGAGTFRQLNRFGLATVVVDLPRVTTSAVARLEDVAAWLGTQPTVRDLPISYFGTGGATTAALLAAARAEPAIAAVLSWNGRFQPAWRQAEHIPTLLMVGAHSGLARWSNWLAHRLLGPNTRLLVVYATQPPAECIADWYNRYVAGSATRRPPRRVTAGRSMGISRGLATAAVFAALSTPLVLPAATVQAHPIATTANVAEPQLTLHASQIRGDGLSRAGQRPDVARQKTGPGDQFSGGIKVGDKQIRGDGHGPLSIKATGSQALVDAGGLKYFVNTNITFSTSSSASGAMSEASFTGPVAASTLGGGTVASTLNDAFDGYNTLCISVNGVPSTCQTGNANFIIYNKNGPATTANPGPVSGVNRQIVFPQQIMGNLTVWRKVFIPDNDAFARWLNFFTNNSATPQLVTMNIANNLGSDSNTIIVSSSNGNNVAELTDTWATTFQNWSGTTSSDPRLGHILQGPGAAVPLAAVNFANGDDNPWWSYRFTLQPGQTGIIMNFVTGQPSKAAAASKAAQLVGLPPNALQFMTEQEKSQVLNFAMPAPTPVPTLSEWGLLSLAGLMAWFGARSLRRRPAG